MNRFPLKLMLPCILAPLLFVNDAQATYTSQGWGRVNMQGAIIDTACAIAAGSRDQAIDMDTVPVADIIRDGRGVPRAFSIELVNCELSRAEKKGADWQYFQVTFDGNADGGYSVSMARQKALDCKLPMSAGILPGRAVPCRTIIYLRAVCVLIMKCYWLPISNRCGQEHTILQCVLRWIITEAYLYR